MQKKRVNIILVNYGSMSHTLACIDSMKLLKGNTRLFVVDNKSSEDPVEVINQYKITPNNLNRFLSKVISDLAVVNVEQFQSSRLDKLGKYVMILNGINSGYGHAVNIALKKILKNSRSDELVWFLNNDTRVQKDTLSHLLSVMNLFGPSGFVSSVLYYIDDMRKIQSAGCGKIIKPWLLTRHCKSHNETFDFLVGTSMLTSLSFIKKIGYYPEDYFLYYEDVAYSLIARKHGGYLKVAEESIVLHAEGGSDKSEADKNRSSVVDFYVMRNRLLLSQKFYTYYIPFVIVSLIYSFSKRVILGEFKKAFGVIRIILFQPFHPKKPIQP